METRLNSKISQVKADSDLSDNSLKTQVSNLQTSLSKDINAIKNNQPGIQYWTQEGSIEFTNTISKAEKYQVLPEFVKTINTAKGGIVTCTANANQIRNSQSMEFEFTIDGKGIGKTISHPFNYGAGWVWNREDHLDFTQIGYVPPGDHEISLTITTSGSLTYTLQFLQSCCMLIEGTSVTTLF